MNAHTKNDKGELTQVTQSIWDERYATQGKLWGDAPSKVAETVADRVSDGSKIIDIGCGYGRDIKYLVNHGHSVHGLEEASAGLTLAVRELAQFAQFGRATLIWGDFASVQLNENSFDAVQSHRVLHLLGFNGLVDAFSKKAKKILKPGGLLVVSARNPTDFDPEQMEWVVEGQHARYTIPGRTGHDISFWDQDRYNRIFGPHFKIEDFEDGEEIESLDNKNKVTRFTTMIARKPVI